MNRGGHNVCNVNGQTTQATCDDSDEDWEIGNNVGQVTMTTGGVKKEHGQGDHRGRQKVSDITSQGGAGGATQWGGGDNLGRRGNERGNHRSSQGDKTDTSKRNGAHEKRSGRKDSGNEERGERGRRGGQKNSGRPKKEAATSESEKETPSKGKTRDQNKQHKGKKFSIVCLTNF